MKSLKEFLNEKGSYQLNDEIMTAIQEELSNGIESLKSNKVADDELTIFIANMIAKYSAVFYDISVTVLVEYVYNLYSDAENPSNKVECKNKPDLGEGIVDKYIADNFNYFRHMQGLPPISEEQLKNATITWRFR